MLGARMQRTVGVDEWFEATGLAEPKRPLWKKLSIDVAWVYPVALMISVWSLAPSVGQDSARCAGSDQRRRW